MNNTYSNIVLPIETTARELNAKLYLAMVLAERGFNVYLGAKDPALEVSCRLPGVIYFDKGFHRGVSEGIYTRLKEAGCLLVSLDEENGVDFRDFFMLDIRMPDDFLSRMDRVLLWGKSQQNYLAEHRESMDTRRVLVTGHPRFDLLAPPLSNLYEAEAQRLRDRYGDFVLYTTNSKFSNNINSREHILKNYTGRVKELERRLEYDSARLAANISLIRRISEELGMPVVVRPHPEENIDTYREAFANSPGIYPIYEGTAVNWILAARTVIHNHSTTGLEAAMLGKWAIAYTPIVVEENFFPWIPVACSHRMHNEDDAVRCLANGHYLTKPEGIDDIMSAFFTHDGRAAQRIAQVVSELAARHAVGNTPTPKGLQGYLVKVKCKRFLNRLLGRTTTTALDRNKLRDLHPASVTAHFRALQSLLPGQQAQLDVLNHDLYRIRKAD